MTDKKPFRVFATSRIGDPAENRLRERGYSHSGALVCSRFSARCGKHLLKMRETIVTPKL